MTGLLPAIWNSSRWSLMNDEMKQIEWIIHIYLESFASFSLSITVQYNSIEFIDHLSCWWE